MKSVHICLLSLTLFLSVFMSCRHEPDLSLFPRVVYRPAQGDTVSIGVKPILDANCATPGCHVYNGGMFSLESYDDIMKGDRIFPGSANKSEIYRCIANRNNSMMPPSGPMSDEAIKSIYLWIEQGAKEN
jgi:hypothetical protein